MAKKRQPTPAEIERKLEELDREIAELKQAKLDEERAALVEPLRVQQAEAIKTFDPFAKAVTKLRSVWTEIESILSESEELREEVEEARAIGRDLADVAPPELARLHVPDSLATVFPDEDLLRKMGILEGYGSKHARVNGRGYVFYQIRRRKIGGLSDREHRSMIS